jgi:solute carrier family 5 (sodium-coupled monocarboxylate transporter), member 8/12
MYIISTILWLPIVSLLHSIFHQLNLIQLKLTLQMIYVPALAFNQLTSVNIHVITPIVMLICIFYTCVGGLKAVVWTDVIQITIMYGTLLTIAVKGTLKVGGIRSVIERNILSERIEWPE